MKRIWALLAALTLGAAALGGCGSPAQDKPDSGKLKVYASFYTMYDFAQKIGGDKVEVVNLVQAGGEPHDWEPSPGDVAALEQADVFIYSGVGLEHWVPRVISSLGNETLITVEAAQNCSVLMDVRTGESDPHVWLSPANATAQMDVIRRGLSQADPVNAAYYQENYERYAAQLEALDTAYREALSPLPGRDIVVAHAAFGYLCQEYGLMQTPVRGYSPDQEPELSRMRQVVDFVRENNITTIFYEEEGSRKIAQAVADEVGGATALLSTLESLTEEQLAAGEDYFSVMAQNLAALEAALS